jgi:hypothetical protein
LRRVLPALVLLAPTVVLADGEASWQDFRAGVETACRAAAKVGWDPGEVEVEVNPFGSESYGIALLTVSGDWGQDRIACIVEKRTGRVELTAAFPPARE